MTITNMTENEVNALIFKNAGVNELVEMPLEIALQVIEMPHLSNQIKDWAWSTIDNEI